MLPSQVVSAAALFVVGVPVQYTIAQSQGAFVQCGYRIHLIPGFAILP